MDMVWLTVIRLTMVLMVSIIQDVRMQLRFGMLR